MYSDEITKKLLSNNVCWSMMTQGLTVYAIILGGSRLFDLQTDSSDYDLDVIVSEEDFDKLEKKYYEINMLGTPHTIIEIDGKEIHWHYMSEWKLPTFCNYGLDFWSIEAAFFWDESKCIYINEEFKNCIKNVKNRLQKIKFDLCKNFYEDTKYQINKYIKEKSIWSYPEKYLYHFCLINKAMNLKNAVYDHQLTLEYKQWAKQHYDEIKNNEQLPYVEKFDKYILKNILAFKDWIEKETEEY